MLKKAKKILRDLELNVNEIFFINYHKKKNSFGNSEFLLLQTPADYYYVCYNKLILDKDKKNAIGVWPYVLHPLKKRFFLINFFNYFFLIIFYYLKKKKWTSIYKSIGVKHIIDLDSNSLFNKINNLFKAIKIFRKIIEKNDIYKISINKIYCGDLIYDTYLRFRVRPTVDVKDMFLIFIIYKIFNIIDTLDNFFLNNNHFQYYTSYSSYVHHGVPVRFFLKKNIKVFSGKNNSQFNKKLSKKDNLHSEYTKDFKKIFKIENKKNQKLIFSKNKLKNIFINKNTFSHFNNQQFKNKNINGIIFLQDFYDQASGSSMIFEDFYSWTIFSIEIVRKFNLNIAFKPHPNNIYESNILIKKIKKLYNDIQWIDPNVPNSILFKKIKFGVSVHGSVLYELAYHNITSIACGNHPSQYYNFSYLAKDKNHYQKLLLKGHLLQNKIKLKDVYEFYYMYRFKNLDYYTTPARDINMDKIDFANSNSLVKFTKKYEDYISRKSI